MTDSATQLPIPFLFLRGGTSRGPFLNRADLPADRETLTHVLVAIVGSGHPLCIDGIGGGNAVTTKVAMLSRSQEEWADVDYLFAQVGVLDRSVDFRPTCGNMLAGVGPAAIEMGLIQITGHETHVRIRAVNTGARITATVQTAPQGVVYDGDAAVDGVPGTAAPVSLTFMDTVGGTTGTMLPTGQRIDRFAGIDVTCMDVAMPMVMARAEAFGITGHESVETLNAMPELFAAMEGVRREAGAAMGMGDVSRSVTPKFGLLASARAGGTAAARYFMPWSAHPTMAVTGAQCIAACILMPGTIADGICAPPVSPATVRLEHAKGTLDVVLDFTRTEDGVAIRSAGIVRTARLLARGEVMVPPVAWNGTGAAGT